MKIEITKIERKTVIIETELPYYYRQDLMSDYSESIVYGKIDEHLHISIQEIKLHDEDSEKYEIEKEEYLQIKDTGLACYFDKAHKSSRQEFEEVKQRCLSFVTQL
jgi:hypothetical protein